MTTRENTVHFHWHESAAASSQDDADVEQNTNLEAGGVAAGPKLGASGVKLPRVLMDVSSDSLTQKLVAWFPLGHCVEAVVGLVLMERPHQATSVPWGACELPVQFFPVSRQNQFPAVAVEGPHS